MINWVREYHSRLLGNRELPQIKFTRTIQIFGAANKQFNYLKFSVPFIEVNDDKRCLEVLVIHEVCHLVVPNHSKDFKRLCKQFGDDVPDGACFSFKGFIAPIGKYHARCKKCGQVYSRARTCPPPKSRSCYKCNEPLIFHSNDTFK